jgi:hypothetical protein
MANLMKNLVEPLHLDALIRNLSHALVMDYQDSWDETTTG